MMEHNFREGLLSSFDASGKMLWERKRSYGLTNGVSGMAMICYWLFRMTGRHHFKEMGWQILEELSGNMDELQRLPPAEGLAGIGWMIEWLSQNGFLDDTDTDEVLGDIDEALYLRVISRGSNGGVQLQQAIGSLRYFIRRSAKIDLGKAGSRHAHHKLWIGLLIDEIRKKIPIAVRLESKQEIIDLAMGIGIVREAVEIVGQRAETLLEYLGKEADGHLSQYLASQGRGRVTGANDFYNVLYLGISYLMAGKLQGLAVWEETGQRYVSQLLALAIEDDEINSALCHKKLTIRSLLYAYTMDERHAAGITRLIDRLLLMELPFKLLNGWGNIMTASMCLSNRSLIKDWNYLIRIDPYCTSVPKIIHQIVGPGRSPLVEECLLSWKDLEQDGYEIMVWDDTEIEAFLHREYPFCNAAFKNARNHGEAADIARYMIVHHLGGHYVDWDIRLLSARRYLEMCGACNDGYMIVDPKNGTIASEAFSAKAGEPFLFSLVSDIVALYNNGSRDTMSTPQYSGPFRMRDSLEKHANSSQCILPVKDVFAYDYTEIRAMPQRDIIQPMIHYWVHSWIAKPSNAS